MKNLKRAASLGLCAVTLLSQLNIQAFAADNSSLAAYEDGTYVAETHFMKSSDITTASMCDSLFYDYATAEVKGEDTTLTFYVVDPIPAFASAGQPLTEVKFTVDGTDYEAAIDSDNKETKSFGTGFGFTAAGDYECDVITVTVPTKAVEDNADGALYCTAFVNAVMSTYQYFYMTLDMDNAQFTPAAKEDEKEEYIEAQGETKEVNAYKTGTTDKSSMANYLYNNVIVADTQTGHSVTLYANAGELGYVKYNDTEAKKYENAKTIDGKTYDAFVIDTAEVADVMNLTVYVNQMAAINPNFAVQSFDLSFVKEEVKDDDTTKTEEKSVVITASVAEEEAQYYVTIPASISLGELSRDTDTVVSYDVVVDVKSMPEKGSVKVSAPESGNLNSGSNVIAFANSFGQVSYTESATTTANISVKADDVKVKGDYQGTTVFNIEYSEAE